MAFTPASKQPPINDKVGNEIKPGCLIAYGHAAGRSAVLRIGKVLNVEYGNMVTQWSGKEGFKCHRLTVMGTNDGPGRKASLLSKKSYLLLRGDDNHVVVLGKVSAEYKEVLDPVEIEVKS